MDKVILGREPVLLMGLFQTLLALGIGFGLDITGEQTALILAALAAVIAVVIRSQVSPIGPEGRVV